MLNNFNLDCFLDYFKILATTNPNKTITDEIIRMEAIRYGLDMNQDILLDVCNIRKYIKDKPTSELNENEGFIQYCHNKSFIKRNCIKLYFPFKAEHFSECVLALTNYLEEMDMTYAVLVSKKMRNDNCTVRVNSLKEANSIISFVSEHEMLKENLMETSPFIPTIEKIGIIKDYYHSYNREMSIALANYIEAEKENNLLEQMSKESFQKYLLSLSNREDLEVDKRKIYYLSANAIGNEKQEYKDMLLEEEIQMNLTTSEGRRKIIEESLLITMRNYNNQNYLKETLKLCCQGVYEGIPREENARKMMLSLSQEEIILEIKAWGNSNDLDIAIDQIINKLYEQQEEINLEDLPIEEVNIDDIEVSEVSLKDMGLEENFKEEYFEQIEIEQIINHAILMTYQKYGREQAIGAMLECVRTGEGNRVAREENARANLQKISVTQMTQFFIRKSSKYSVAEAIVYYVDQLINNYELEDNIKKK